MFGPSLYIFLASALGILTTPSQGLVDLEPGVAIIPGPSVLVVQKNSPLMLNCSAISGNDYKPVRYSWTKDGVPLIPSKRVQIVENGSLYFKHIKRRKRINYNDEGEYICLLTNSEGTVIGRPVQIKVARIARSFRTEPEDQQVVIGGVARFQCDIDATSSVVYVWLKNDASLPPDDRITKLASGILQIDDVHMSDTGSYQCTACHSFQEIVNLDQSKASIHCRQSNQAALTVINDPTPRPPSVVFYTKRVDAVVDQAVTLECLVDGNPRPTVNWFKEMKSHLEVRLVPVEEDIFKVRRGSGNLEFKEVDPLDDGIYHCVASAPGHPDNIDLEIKLNVKEPPVIDKGPDSVYVQIAQRVRLGCVVHGIPKPTITWYRNGREISANGHVFLDKNKKELRIESVLSDSGYYQCIAENSVGHVMATARVKVTKKELAPEPPQNLEAVVLSSTEIFVKWNQSRIPENCNCEIVAYTLHYKEVTPDAQDRKEPVPETSKLVKGLHPFTTYEFYVIAYATQGASMRSEKVQETTLEWVPTSAPKITLTSIVPAIIDITWKPLPKADRNGIINRYKIFYRDEHSPVSYSPVEVLENITRYQITGLKPDTLYFVRVLAGTSVGYPNMTESRWPWVPHKTVSGGNQTRTLSSNMYVTTINNTAVQIDWSVSNVSQPITGYRLFVNKVLGKNYSKMQYFEASTTSYLLTGLENMTFYEVSLVIQSNDEILEIKTEMFQTHPPDVQPMPPPPWNLKPVALSATQIKVTWQQPSSPREITMYTVRYSREHHNNFMMKISKSASIVLDHLEPVTRYNISVRSHTQFSHGPFSNPVFSKTKEGVPSAPISIHVQPLSNFEVMLTWSPPTEENGEIIYYVIMYNIQKEEPDSSWNSLQQNGSTTSVIIKNLSDKMYYFKMMAVTRAGPGPCSPPIQVILQSCTIDCPIPESETAESTGGSVVHDQRLGIIMGCSVGLASIIICVLVVVLRQRHYARLARQHQANAGQHAGGMHTHQNGHAGLAALPGAESEQGPCAHYPLLGDHRITKGPTNGVILSGNGKIIYLCNNGDVNGRLKAVVAEPFVHGTATSENPEQRALLSTEVTESNIINDDLSLQPMSRSHDPDADNGNHGSNFEVSYDPSFGSRNQTHTNSPTSASQDSNNLFRGRNSCLDNSCFQNGQYSPQSSGLSADRDSRSTSHSLNQGKHGVPQDLDGASLNETNICSGSHDDAASCSSRNGNYKNSGNDCISNMSYGENSGNVDEQCSSSGTSTTGESSSNTPDKLRKGENSLSSDELLNMMLESTTSKDYADCAKNETTSLSAAGGQSSRVKDSNPSIKQSGVNNTLPHSARPRSRSPGSRSPVTMTTADD